MNTSSACIFATTMGVDGTKSLCRLVCRHGNLTVLRNIVAMYPDWKPSYDDLAYTVLNGDLDQLQWLVSEYHMDFRVNLGFQYKIFGKSA